MFVIVPPVVTWFRAGEWIGRFGMGMLLYLWLALSCPAQTPDFGLVREHWFETRTAHFHIYSCGAPTAVFKLAGRLEQFCEAYAWLAGSTAIASPPIAVVAFPDHERLQPFLPLYEGQPANLAAFFKRGSDENLIVLSLPPVEAGADDMSVIFHEYTHLLFRHNDHFWPMWMKEGMAEVYSTFATAGGKVSIAGPIPYHLALLKENQLMPLSELFTVTHDSPQYNESSRQGIFYAESWLLAEFLVAGDRPVLRERFGQYTALLKQGQPAEEAFTNALHITLAGMTAQLQRYLANREFPPLQLKLTANIAAPITVTTRALTPVETYFRLGDELLRIDRVEAARAFFDQALKIAPASPLPYEGKGLLASQLDNHEEALRELTEALQRGSGSFLAYFIYARERYRLTSEGGDRYKPLKDAAEVEVRGNLEKSLSLMPVYAPAHELLGFFDMVQGDQAAEAERQLQWAIELEPENSAFLFTLAQFQFRNGRPEAARQTLEPLLKPNVAAELRQEAEKLLQEHSHGE